MASDTTSFDIICDRFYKRLEKDDEFFNYYNIEMSEAQELAHKRAKGYLIDVLDKLSQVGDLQVDFSDYDEELEVINFEIKPKEIRLIVDLMFQEYMERDIPLLHAFKINFTPSDLNIITPSTERRTYTDLIDSLNTKNEASLDNYKNRDRNTGKLLKVIDYSKYGDE